MAPKKSDQSKRSEVNKGTWTPEEDHRLAQVIEIYGPRKWKSVAVKAGLNRCGKSCRLRWMNYLRPNIKRGNISDQEEDLILRLHKLLGNRWALIAGRLPGRTDNEIKNYWNSHLSKKISQKETKGSKTQGSNKEEVEVQTEKEHLKVSEEGTSNGVVEEKTGLNMIDEFFDFPSEGISSLEWVSKFLEIDEVLFGLS